MNEEVLDAGEKILGKIFRERREDLGLTQAELALRMNIKQVTISRIEAGKFSPSWRMVMRFLEALELYVFFEPKDGESENAKWMREHCNPADYTRYMNRKKSPD
jgi:transcriptional regulator with XRE-family HTH domain